MSLRYILFAVLLTAVTAIILWKFGEIDAPSFADADDPGLVERGGQVYAEHCTSCHGADLKGQPDWEKRRPDGRLPAPPHDESGHTWHHPDEQNFKVTKLGVAAFAPAGYQSDMMGFKDILTDAEIWASLAYIKSRWPEAIRRRHAAMSGRSQ